MESLEKGSLKYLPRENLQKLFDILIDSGYRCIGPKFADDTILFDEIHDARQLPGGISDIQSAGSWRPSRHNSDRQFAWANGPQALKPFMFKPEQPLWQVERDDLGHYQFNPVEPQAERLAFIGLRACDLAALNLQDKHFIQGLHADPYYTAQRKKIFMVAVNCSHPAETCFCVSTGDGPRAKEGYDLVLTELENGFLIDHGSEQGHIVLQRLKTDACSDEHMQSAVTQYQQACAGQQKRLPSRNLSQTLFGNLEHPQWEDIAERCLGCGNCTSVCPTCFCHSEYEQADISGNSSQHLRHWDSCFSAGHSYIHGLNIRPDIRFRYRQWLTHKLGSWHEQYGRSGCVGCGRCISWCPVGIDITVETEIICKDGY